LRLVGCPPADPAPIAGLIELRQLDLTSTDLPDLSVPAGLRQLRELRLRDLHTIPDLAPLSALDRLERLTVTGMGRLGLQPLAGRSGLQIRMSDLVEPVGAELLGPGSAVVVTNSAEVDSGL
jgi:Leucine-rich repeat (LRR) protein